MSPLIPHGNFIGAAVLSVLVTGAAMAQEPTLTRVPPFDGARFGAGYDKARGGLTETARACVDIDSNKTFDQSSDKDNASFTHQAERASELASKMELSVEAQLRSLSGTYKTNTNLEVAHKTTATTYSASNLYVAKRFRPTRLLTPEHIRLKPEFAKLLKGGVKGLDEFRAKCGDAFVIGLQTGSYFYATVTKDTSKTEKEQSTILKVSWDINGSIISEGYANYIKSVKTIHSAKDDTVKRSTSADTPNPTTREEVERQFVAFKASDGERLVEVVVAPYTVAEGALPNGVLDRDPNDEALKRLLAALWDLKTLADAADQVLRSQGKFALGTPTSGKREIRLKHVGALAAKWAVEFNELLTFTKACAEKFSDSCLKRSLLYASAPKIQEQALLPTQYASQCNSTVEVRMDNSKGGPISLEPRSGDRDMHGGPVKISVALRLWRANETLLNGRLSVFMQEDKKDWSTYDIVKNFAVLDLKAGIEAQLAGEKNPLEECVIADRWTQRSPVAPPDYFGLIATRTSKNQSRITLTNGGLLNSVTCDVFSPKNKGCDQLAIEPISVLMVNRLDIEADKWSAPLPPAGFHIMEHHAPPGGVKN